MPEQPRPPAFTDVVKASDMPWRALHARPLPWWTWIAPAIVCHIGTRMSLATTIVPGVSAVYLPIPFAMVMAFWWGPRVLLGVYLNAYLCAGFWNLRHEGYFPLYAMPETLAVLAGWWLFIVAGKGKCWLPDIGHTLRFVLLAIFPAALINAFCVAGQFVLCGEIEPSTFWQASWAGGIATLLDGLAIAAPMAVFLTPIMERRGWSRTRGAAPISLAGHVRSNAWAAIEIAGAFLAILVIGRLMPLERYWSAAGVFLLWAALRYGVGLAVLANLWLEFVAILLPWAVLARTGLAPAPDVDLENLQMALTMLCLASLVTGRTISDQIEELSQRKRAEEALKISDARHRTLIEAAPEAVVVLDAERGCFVEVNQNACELFNAPLERLLPLGPLQLSPPRQPDGRESAEAAAIHIGQAIAGGKPAFEWMHRTVDGRDILCEVRLVRLPDPSRVLVRGSVTDITVRKRAEESLREHAQTLETMHHVGQLLVAELDIERLVQAVTDAGTRLTGAQFGAFFYNVTNQQGESYLLYTVSGVPREKFSRFPMPRNTDLFRPTFEGSGVVRIADVHVDPRYGHSAPHFGMPPGHLPVSSYLAVPVRSRSGEIIGGLFFGHEAKGVFKESAEHIVVGLAASAAIALDNARLFQKVQQELAERKLAEAALRSSEERLRFMMQELDHRVKNNLAAVSSMAHQMLASADSLPAFQRSFTGRIDALARMHAALARTKWEGIDITGLLEMTLNPHGPAGDERIHLRGPRLTLPARAASPLGMTFHEMATNALKYGALSTSAGRVEVEWKLTDDRSGIDLTWIERGGPPVAPPSRRGFGSDLIDGVITHELGGRVELDYSPEGLVCRMSIPIIDRETQPKR